MNTDIEIMQAKEQRREWLRRHVGLTPVDGLPYRDELMERYYKLVDTSNIENMVRYAFEWHVLAEDFAKAGRPAMAARCESDAKRYGEYSNGEAVYKLSKEYGLTHQSIFERLSRERNIR